MRLDGRSEDIARYETRTNYILICVSIIEVCDGRIELKCEVDKEPEKCGVLRLDGTSATDHITALIIWTLFLTNLKTTSTNSPHLFIFRKCIPFHKQ